MAFDGDAVQPKNMPPLSWRGSILSLRARKAPCARTAPIRKEGPPHGGTQIFADLLGGSFSRLQGDVAGEAVSDNDIDRAPADIVTFDETLVANGKRRFLENGGRLLDFVETLGLFDADIASLTDGFSMPNTPPWPRPSGQLGELPHPLRGQADIEHDAFGLDGRRWRRWRGVMMPGIVFSRIAMAISAPVLPAETAASARPSRTASSASHMLDFQRPLRSAWLGFSSMATAMSVNDGDFAASAGGHEAPARCEPNRRRGGSAPRDDGSR